MASGGSVAKAFDVPRKPTTYDAWSGGALLEPETDLAGPVDESPLQGTLRTADESAALRAFDEAALESIHLAPREWLRLSGILERADRPGDAIYAARKALAEDPYGVFAPRAMFTVGRVLAERLNHREKARAVFESLIKHFPQDDFAARAAEAVRRMAVR